MTDTSTMEQVATSVEVSKEIFASFVDDRIRGDKKGILTVAVIGSEGLGVFSLHVHTTLRSTLQCPTFLSARWIVNGDGVTGRGISIKQGEVRFSCDAIGHVDLADDYDTLRRFQPVRMSESYGPLPPPGTLPGKLSATLMAQ